MSSWAEEADSAQDLAHRAAQELLELDPTNELLKFAFVPEEDCLPDGSPDPEKDKQNRTAMKDRFWQRDEPWQEEAGVKVVTIVMANYYLALKEEIQRLKSATASV